MAEQQFAITPIGEWTGNQVAGASLAELPAFSDPKPGTYDTYREMSADPTIALAKLIVTAPIMANTWSFEAHEDTPPEWKDFVKEQFESKRPLIVKECLRALEYGNQPFEKVWAYEDGMIVLKKLKPLLPDMTKVLVEKRSGRYMGLAQGDLALPPIKTFLCIHDREGDNYYGRSRHENARKEWSKREQVDEKFQQLITKLAGLIGAIYYPPGVSKDATGADVPNEQVAKRMADAVAAGKFVYLANLFAAVDAKDDASIQAAAQMAGKSQWLIDVKDPGGQGLSDGFLNNLRYRDARLFRAWLRPERSALESSGGGTLAESEVHADIAVVDSEQIDQDFARQVSWYVVDDLLAMNYGEEARGSVWIAAPPLVDRKRAILVKILDALLQNPGILETLLEQVDVNSVADGLGVPKKVEEIDLTMSAPTEKDRQPVPPEDQQQRDQQMQDQYEQTNEDKGEPEDEAKAA